MEQIFDIIENLKQELEKTQVKLTTAEQDRKELLSFAGDIYDTFKNDNELGTKAFELITKIMKH